MWQAQASRIRYHPGRTPFMTPPPFAPSPSPNGAFTQTIFAPRTILRIITRKPELNRRKSGTPSAQAILYRANWRSRRNRVIVMLQPG